MLGTIIGGRFRLEQKAGSGGMGTVYRAHDLLDGNAVAVKLLESEEVRDGERFEQEAGILARLHHPAIVRYVAHGRADDRPFLAMEWLEGIDLETRIDRDPLSLHEGLAVLKRTAEALEYAHAEGVIHRDLKPQNLFLPGGSIERLKLLDFGIARLTNANRKLTQTGYLVGTPGYLAPEILSGTRPDGRADLFSLGCLVFRCLTGRPPFDAEDATKLLAQMILQEAPILADVVPSIPREVSDLVARLLMKDPAQRPPNAAAVIEALAGLGELPDLPAEYRRRRNPRRITLTEKRLAAFVLGGPDPFASETPPDTFVAEMSARFGIVVQAAPDGSFVMVLPAVGKATDIAARAARAALHARTLLPWRSWLITSGQVPTNQNQQELASSSAAVSSARPMLLGFPPDRIVLQDIVAALIESRFDLQREGVKTFLGEECAQVDVFEAKRHLLGKATEFVGRGRELASLLGMLTACADEGTANAALVLGPAGMGKSRLLQEFMEQARKQQPRMKMLFGIGDSLAAGSPFGILARALRRYTGVVDGEPADESRRKFFSAISAHLAPGDTDRVTAFLGEVAYVNFPDAHHPSLRAARGNPQVMGDLIRRAFEDWLTAEAQDHPVLFVLEDLHWGDAGTVGLFDAALRNLREQPIMVLALARPEVRQTFPDLWHGRALQVFELAPLARKVAEKLIREGLGPEAPPTLVHRMVARADGNPFFIEELIRAGREGRADALPGSVLGMVQARLDAEGAEAKQVLRAASVFGERFSRNGLAALLGGEAELADVMSWLERLIAREIISRGTAPEGAEGEFMFAHALVREAAYAALTEEDLVLGHKLAGEYLEVAGCPDAMTLAEHFHRGLDLLRAIGWYRLASEQALRANDLSGAIQRAGLGLSALESLSPAEKDEVEAETPGALSLCQAEAHLWRAEFAHAETRGTEAVAALRPGEALWFRAAGQTLIAAAKQGKLDALSTWVDKVRAVDPARDASNAQALCFAWAASFLLAAARTSEAEELMDGIAATLAFASNPDPQALALLHQARAARASLAGDPAACLASLVACENAFAKAGDIRNLATVRANVGFILSELGAWERAENALREALAEADRMGLVELRAIVQHNLGRAVAFRGDLEEAERLERMAIDSFVEQGEPRLEGLARIYLAEIKQLGGGAAEAADQASKALDVLAGAPAHQVQARAVLARAQLALGQAMAALGAAEKAAADLAALGSIDEGEADVRLVFAECLKAAGRNTEARQVISRAQARLDERAALIADEDLRQRFLSEIPAHARTVRLAEDWTPPLN